MNKTIFVLLDACQYEAGTRNLAFLEHLVDYGKGAKYKVKGEIPSQSRPIYATLLTGLPVCEHGIIHNAIGKTLDIPNLFSLCKENGGVTAAAAYSWVSELFNQSPFQYERDYIQLNTGKQIDHGIFYWEDMYPDSHVIANGEFLLRSYDPDFLMVHTMFIDYIGHIFGSESKEYENSVALAGNVLAAPLTRWLEAGYNVVITADHGMNRMGMHGGTDEIQRGAPLYIFSKQVQNGRFEEDYISQLNIAPLLCRLLGVDVPKTMKQQLEIAFRQPEEGK
jgi:predicted AlkP superfamily pyrophosphatase or phosphodiesterase